MATDEDLMLKVAEGEEAAIEVIVRRHYDGIFSFIYRMTQDHHTAEDLTQETFVKLYKSASLYTYPRPFKPWLYTIARNLCKDHFKSAYQRHNQSWENPEEARSSESSDTLGEFIERQEERKIILNALNEMTTAHKEVLILRYYHHLSLEEISQIQGIPIGTVKSRLSYAVKKMRAWFCINVEAQGGN
jgi:RNA polymerase sigma-70 factor (ECF subfamily)